MERFLWVCLGSAVGGGGRYLLHTWMLEQFGPAFPWGTLTVNVLGSFLLGAVMFAGVEADALSPTLRWALGAGLLGGFTTYSTFSFETMRLLQQHDWAMAGLNVLATLALCLGATFLGFALMRYLLH